MNHSLSEPAECPICKVGSLVISYRATPLDYSGNHDYPILICSQCGYGKTGEIKQQPPNLYAGGCYDVREKAWHRLIKPLLSALEQGKLCYLGVNKEILGKKLLEIGCGKGRFLEVAKKHGVQVYGIEPSPRSFAFASDRLGSSVSPIGLKKIDEAPSFPSKFDYVMLWHVLEHLSDPGSVLSKIKEKLESDGRVVIAVPNFASFQARLGKSDWYHLDPPRHMHHFTPQSLHTLVVAKGYEVKKIFFNSLYQNFVGDLITLINKILPGNNVVFNGLRINRAYLDRFGAWGAWAMFIFGSALSLLIALPVLLFTLFSQLIGRSGTMVVIIKPTK
ncbi:methyltransferase domain-containing protein [Geotalea uraniireducens]|uniref:Methyltransferase type 12 n=1 Tax=Geotalea uraniireducens (strain Rf4) TaxID=351605 RepID=A5G606_GEOUR|nr:methyltransferase domain-containing protein [Geotalea uraniireducens]ABQ27224.1 Methyltransferase type 12 [Geotalea uraniireducens Rf4]